MLTAHVPDQALIGLAPAFLDSATEPYYDSQRASHQVFSHAHVLRLTTDKTCFSQAFGDLTPGDPNSRMMWLADGRRHRDLRNLVRDPFGRQALDQLEPAILAITAQLMDSIECHDGPFEVFTELAAPLPGMVICQIMGIDLAHDKRFDRWLADFVAAAALHQTPEQTDKWAFFADLLAERKRHPQGGLVDALIAAQKDGHTVDGSPLSDADLIGYLWGMVAAGRETTAAAISNMLLILSEWDWAPLRENPGLRGGAIAECLRLCSPFPMVMARATADVTFGTYQVAAGKFVTGWLSAASRDPAKFPQPDLFDPGRPPGPSPAFAWGPHRCLGERLALLEMRVVLDAALNRWPSLRWDRSRPYRRSIGISNRVAEAWMWRQ